MQHNFNMATMINTFEITMTPVQMYEWTRVLLNNQNSHERTNDYYILIQFFINEVNRSTMLPSDKFVLVTPFITLLPYNEHIRVPAIEDFRNVLLQLCVDDAENEDHDMLHMYNSVFLH